MARRSDGVDQSSEGDWSINLKQTEAPNLTVELETADLKSLATEGTIQPMTVELSTLDIQYVAPGHSGYTAHEVGRIMGESTSVLVDFGDEPAKPSGPSHPRASTPLPPTAALPSLPPKTVVDLSPTKPAPDLSNLLPAAPVGRATPRSTPIPPGPITPRSIAVPTPTAVSMRAQTATDEDTGGMGLVVIVYLLAAGALGISIYLRWFA